MNEGNIYLSGMGGDYDGQHFVPNLENIEINNWKEIIPNITRLVKIFNDDDDLLVMLGIDPKNLDKEILSHLKSNGAFSVDGDITECMYVVTDISKFNYKELLMLSKTTAFKQSGITVIDTSDELVEHLGWIPTKNKHLFIGRDVEKDLTTGKSATLSIFIFNNR